MKMEAMYEQLGVSRAVYEYGEEVLASLRPRFDAIDQTAEYNQAKVLAAMQKNRVNAAHFAATTGYGYDDEGQIYYSCFFTHFNNIFKYMVLCSICLQFFYFYYPVLFSPFIFIII